MSVVEAELIPKTMDRRHLMRLLGVGKTRLNEVINLLIETVPGEFDYRQYDRRFTDRHYYQINYAIRLCHQHGRKVQSILESEGLPDGFS